MISSIEDIIKDAEEGKMFILVDDESRENEGDLVIPAAKADASAVNFMAKYGRGLICLALDKSKVQKLQLPLMAKHNNSRHQTAFTVSIEAAEGVTTGISAADRAETIKVAINSNSTPQDIATPGHIFPLEAREGGVLVRAGHTEAAVDIARIAGLNPSGVICEIMNDDGTMARMPDLIEFAKSHNLKIAKIADLIAYRRKYDKLVKRELETTFSSWYGGDFNMIVYSNTVEYAEHIALVKGDINPDKPTYVRIHALDVLGDVLGDKENGRSKQKSMEIISKHGGILLLMREPSKTSLSEMLKKRINGVGIQEDLVKDYGIGAQILIDLGVRDMILLANSEHTIIGLEGYGLSIKEYRDMSKGDVRCQI